MILTDWLRSIHAWLLSRAVVGKDEGATLVEYGLLVALIAVVVMGTVFLLGGQINVMFQRVLDRLVSITST